MKLIILPNAPLHIIDHGSLVYLILLQISFYNQQYSLSLTTPYESSADAIIPAMMTTSMHYDNNLHDDSCQSTYNNNDGSNNDVHHVVIKVYDMTNDTLVSVSVFDEATKSVAMMKSYDLYFDTTFYTTFTSGIVTKPYNNEYDFDLNIAFDILFNYITFIASDDGANNCEASSAVTLKPTPYESDDNKETAVLMTTALSVSPSCDIDTAVNNGILSVAIANKAQYDYYYGSTVVLIASPSIGIDVESSADITKTTILHASPSYDVDTELSAVSVANEATFTTSATVDVGAEPSADGDRISSATIADEVLFDMTLYIYIYIYIYHFLLLS